MGGRADGPQGCRYAVSIAARPLITAGITSRCYSRMMRKHRRNKESSDSSRFQEQQNVPKRKEGRMRRVKGVKGETKKAG